jgi:tetratricopeptide (TPR) repeat protein
VLRVAVTESVTKNGSGYALDFSILNSRFIKYLACLLLVSLAPGGFAAPGFITGSKVTRGNALAEVTIELACGVEYIDHFPVDRGETLRIQLEATTICNGVSPLAAQSREQYRPLQADLINLQEIIYDGNSSGGQILTLVFGDAVEYEVLHSGTSNTITVRLRFEQPLAKARAKSGASGVRVRRPPEPQLSYAINLSSSRQPHAESDMSAITISAGLEVFETEVVLAGATWYRLRLGHFNSTAEAQVELLKLRDQYPTAWIDRADDGTTAIAERRPDAAVTEPTDTAANTVFASIGLDQIDVLMNDARLAMVAKEYSRAVQIYTKVLRVPNHDRHPEAQELLALCREKNGQEAHARAEYQKYLSLYPDDDGATRVNQRLAALLAVDRRSSSTTTTSDTRVGSSRSTQSDWRIQTYFSQYYRRDVNQMNSQDEIISQSALYSDVNFDARRRGQRFDFSSRISAGYRSDFLDAESGSGNDVRISYAYADLADVRTGLRGRVGRQSRNTGGVLGRFDGLNLGYQASDRVLVNAVMGMPVNSSSAGINSERKFYGASVTYGPILEDLELGMFYVQQDIEGIDDRQAIGAEFRYFGANQSLWGMLDYDTLFKEIGSAYLHGSWRFANRLTLHGSLDRRRSPFLSTGNAIIGQPVASFAELAVIFSEDELRQLGIDRTSIATTFSLGVSHSLTPRLQISADVNQTDVDGTPASGGVEATQKTSYEYYSANLTASSLLKEGDVSIIGLRYSTSDTAEVISASLDTRMPFGEKFRINPRLRVDRRKRLGEIDYEWIYTPGLRMQLRWSRKFRMELEVGKQFVERQTNIVNLDRESYFINLGYQAFF